MDRHARELEGLLSQRHGHIDNPAFESAGLIAAERAPLLLYGAGSLGQAVLARLRERGIEPAAFADETPSKQGRQLAGVPILSLADAVARYPHAVFAVTILNPKLRFVDAERRLRRHGAERVVSFLHLAQHFPEQFLPYLQFEPPAQLMARAADIVRGLELFADEESRRQFVAHVRFRLQLAFDALPARPDDGYFGVDFLAPLPDDVTFIDCGAYDGDTIRDFLAHQNDRFGEILAFEPDPANYERLCAYVAGLAPAVARKIVPRRAGVGARCEKLAFSATGDMGASIDDRGNCTIDTVALHECIEPGRRSVFIKYDVEGAEDAALAGTEPLIRADAPSLAVSVYHRPADLWTIPLDLHAMNPAYRLFLRTLGHDGMDVICYAAAPDAIAADFAGASGKVA